MDEVDLKLLEALQQDCRIQNKELADHVGLSTSRCSRRRLLLEEAGIITGYHAAVANRAVGLDILAFLQVSLSSQAPNSAQAFAALVRDMNEVQEAYALTGDSDYLVKLVVPDLETLSQVINKAFLPHRSVERVRSSIVLDYVKETKKLPLRNPRSLEQLAKKRSKGRLKNWRKRRATRATSA